MTPASSLVNRTAAMALRALRREIMAKLGYFLRELYRTLEDPGHNDPLAFLLTLNLTLAKEKAGEKITPPGLPLPNESALVTEDCIIPGVV